MKYEFVGGSSLATAFLAKLDTTVAFLADRQQAIDLSQTGRQMRSAYVWRRIFLKGRTRKP